MSGVHWSAPAFALLCSAAWQAAVIVGVAALLARRYSSANARSAIWTCALILSTLVPLASAALPKYVWGFGPVAAAPPIASVPGPMASDAWWQPYVVLLWSLGAVASAARLLQAWLATARLVRLSQPVATSAAQNLLGSIVWRRSIELRSLSSLLSPFCWQFRRTVLVLPASVEDFPEEELEMVLRHELVHLRRQDPLWLFLERVAEAVFWYHPAVWWAGRQASKYREFACDDAAIHEPVCLAPYLRCIDRMVRARPAPTRHAQAALGLGWERKLLVLRLRRLTGAATPGGAVATLGQRLLGGVALLVVAAALVLVRVGGSPFAHARSGWTRWPAYTARSLHALGLPVRDFELDAHRLNPRERALDHVLAHQRRLAES